MHWSLLGHLAAIAAGAGLVLALGRSEERVARLVVARNAPARPRAPPARPPCASDMVLVEGAFCPEVRQECLEHVVPYPYAFTLDETACGTGRTDLMGDHGRLADHRRPRGSAKRCVSPFGVFDMAGNLEEHVVRTRLSGSVGTLRADDSVMKGADWQPGDHRCRAGQTAHDQYYKGVETGFRCCRDAD